MSIHIDHLNFAYDDAPTLRDLSVTFEKGAFYGILGPNGSGKSTMIKLMAGLIHGPKGAIQLNNRGIHTYSKPDLAKLIAFVPQMFTMKFAFTVFDIVLMGRYPYIRGNASPSRIDLDLVEKALVATDLASLKDRPVQELSGGEIQRVLIARSIAQDTPWIFLDEPISHLDIAHQYQIMELLQTLCKDQGKTIIAVLHDLNITLRYCQKTLLLREGQALAFGATHSVLTPDNVEKAYQLKVDRLQINEHHYIHWRD